MIDATAQVMVSPLNQFILGVVAGLCIIKFSKKRQKLGKGLVVMSSIWLLLCSQYFFSHWLVSPLEDAFEPNTLNSPTWKKADGIWVLACYHFDAEELPLVSQFNHCSLERLVHAANMYRLHPTPIYLTGADFVKKSDTFHTTRAAALLKSLGVEEKDIVLVHKGENTAEEAKAVAMHVNNKMLAVISSATHGKRLSMILSDLGISYSFVPVHYSTKGGVVYRTNFPALQSLSRSERAMYEYAAIAKYYLFNRTSH